MSFSAEIFQNSLSLTIFKDIYDIVFFTLSFFGGIIYLLWFLYFISQFWTLLRLRRTEYSHENADTRYKHKTEYYKVLFLIGLTLVEPLNFILHMPGYILTSFIRPENLTNSTCSIYTEYSLFFTLHTLPHVIGFASLCQLNTFTIYMLYVSRSYTEFSPIKWRLRNLFILIIFLFILTLLTVIGALIAKVLVIIIGIYEYVQLISNSKQLYLSLKRCYQNLFEYNLFRERKRITLRYRRLTIVFLVFISCCIVSYSINAFGSIICLLVNNCIQLIGIQNRAIYIDIYQGFLSTAELMLLIPTTILFLPFSILSIHFFTGKGCLGAFKIRKSSQLLQSLIA